MGAMADADLVGEAPATVVQPEDSPVVGARADADLVGEEWEGRGREGEGRGR